SLLEIVAARVVVEAAEPRAGILLEQMVLPNVLTRAETRKDGFCARAEAGEVVRFDAAGGNDQIGLDQCPIDSYTSAPSCSADLDQRASIRRIVVDDAVPPPSLVGQAELADGTRLMRAIRDRKCDRGVGNGRELLAHRLYEILARLIAGCIADDDRDACAGRQA